LNLNHSALTPQKVLTVHINLFALHNLSAFSAKDSNGSRVKSNQKTPNSQMKKLMLALDITTLTINPDSKGMHQ
jgi:hypothetical protein